MHRRERPDLHDHQSYAVRVRPGGALEGDSKVDGGHVWLPDAHIRSGPQEGVLQHKQAKMSSLVV